MHLCIYIFAGCFCDDRAKNVRRAGSSTEAVGLEALHPPQGPPGSGAPALSGLPDMSKTFTVLGIETSCDDTAAAVVRSDGAVLGEVCDMYVYVASGSMFKPATLRSQFFFV